MKQYLDLCQRIVDQGKWVVNDRTGERCLTVINADFTYDVDEAKYPLVTTRKSPIKLAIAELLGYIRGYSNAADFRKLGTRSWDANANENEAWLKNPHRKGKDDCGRIYGVQARSWQTPDGTSIDQLQKVVNNLKNGIDDRGEIITFYNPGEFHMGCLRPCMHSHQFSLLDGELFLNSTSRSVDVPLGLVANMQQVYVFLAVMAQITGHKPGKGFHKLVNCHIYENQFDLMKDVQLKREPLEQPKLIINPDIKTLKDLETWVTVDDFVVEGYEHYDPIEYPFSV